MAIRYHCPNCGQFLSIAARLVGRRTKCPACSAEHVVPEADDSPRAVPTRVRTAPPQKTSPTESGRIEKERVPPRTAEKPKPEHAEAEPISIAPTARETHPAPASTLPQGPSIPISYEIDPLEDEDDEEALVIGKIERKSDELDLIPMVDCVFLLLVFYMITASYALQKTIEMGKPAAEKKGALQSVQTADDTTQSSIVVQIDARNRISVDDIPLASASGLADVLRAKMNGDQKHELVVEADPRAFNETIVAVVDAAHELQFQHVRMAMTAGDGD
jgi:biopolymer transport protein ExbD